MSKLQKLANVARTRADSWYNALTGLGNALRDKQMATRFIEGTLLSDDVLDG